MCFLKYWKPSKHYLQEFINIKITLETQKEIVQILTIIVNIIIRYHAKTHLKSCLNQTSITTFDKNINLRQKMYNTDKILEYFIGKELKIKIMSSCIIC